MSKITSISTKKNKPANSQQQVVNAVDPKDLPDGSYAVIAEGKSIVKKDGVFLVVQAYKLAGDGIESTIAMVERQIKLQGSEQRIIVPK